MNLRNPFYLLIGIVLLSSCAGKKELVTYWKPDLKADQVKITGYDFESKLKWTASNDNDYLYFDISCSDPTMQQVILRSGVTVYLDTAHRKREYVYFKYPVIRRPPQQRGNRQRSSYQQQQGIDPQMIEAIKMSPVYWQDGEIWRLEDPLSDSSKFQSSISIDSTKALKLFVAVPLENLHPKGINGLDKLSVGFTIQRGMSGRSRGGQAGGQRMTGGSGGGGGRGGRGGRGGGGGGRGGSGGSMGGGQMTSGMSQGGGPIAFWYTTTLSKR